LNLAKEKNLIDLPAADTATPNSERVYAISADQGSSKRLDLDERSRVPASKNFEFLLLVQQKSAR
jgi:hypothetical protein